MRHHRAQARASRYKSAAPEPRLSRNTTIAVSVTVILLMFANGWQAWTIHDLRADLETAEGQIDAVKLRVAAAMGPAALEASKQRRKTEGKATQAKAKVKTRSPRRSPKGRMGHEPPPPPGSGLTPSAMLDKREAMRGHLRNAVLNKMLDGVADVAVERGWQEGVAADTMRVLEDSFAATAEVRVAMDRGDFTAEEAKDEVARIKDETSYDLEDVLGPEEHQYLQDRLWSKDAR